MFTDVHTYIHSIDTDGQNPEPVGRLVEVKGTGPWIGGIRCLGPQTGCFRFFFPSGLGSESWRDRAGAMVKLGLRLEHLLTFAVFPRDLRTRRLAADLLFGEETKNGWQCIPLAKGLLALVKWKESEICSLGILGPLASGSLKNLDLVPRVGQNMSGKL